MGTIRFLIREKKYLGILIPLLLLNSCIFSQDEKKDFIYGKWKYVKDLTLISIYSEKNVEDIRNSILHIDKDKVYFDSNANYLFDMCYYKKISIKAFSDRYLPEPDIGIDYALPIYYTKDEIMKLKRIELDCENENNCLGSMYLKQDTLILNSCGGITLFFVKLK